MFNVNINFHTMRHELCFTLCRRCRACWVLVSFSVFISDPQRVQFVCAKRPSVIKMVEITLQNIDVNCRIILTGWDFLQVIWIILSCMKKTVYISGYKNTWCPLLLYLALKVSLIQTTVNAIIINACMNFPSCILEHYVAFFVLALPHFQCFEDRIHCRLPLLSPDIPLTISMLLQFRYSFIYFSWSYCMYSSLSLFALIPVVSSTNGLISLTGFSVKKKSFGKLLSVIWHSTWPKTSLENCLKDINIFQIIFSYFWLNQQWASCLLSFYLHLFIKRRTFLTYSCNLWLLELYRPCFRLYFVAGNACGCSKNPSF